ncbi:MAG: M36 family metallopeptidase [Bacteroidota bacterium]
MRSLAFPLTLAFLAALPVAAQDLAASPGAIETALNHVRGQAVTTSLTASDLADVAVSSSHQSRRSGLTYVYVQQRVAGIDVAEAVVTVAIGRDGKVVHAAGDLVAGASTVSKVATLSAEAALSRAASLLGLPAPSTTSTDQSAKASRRTIFGAIAEIPVAAELIIVGSEERGVRLAWKVRLPTADGRHVWQVRLDAQTGEEISRFDEVIHDHWGPHEDHVGSVEEHALEPALTSFAPVRHEARTQRAALAPFANAAGRVGSYTVYAMPEESPTWITPFPTDGRTTVANPDDATASPFGWHDTDGIAGAEFTITRGNNVYAYTDLDGNNVPDTGGAPDGGASLTFDATLAPINLSQDPSTYRPAAVVNLFYWNNIIHDVLYQYGFTGASGNFQTTNYGSDAPTGYTAIDDAVYAEAQDNALGSGNCNANFWTPNDDGSGASLGPRPRMQMYTCDLGNPDTDSDLDNGVIVHEYGHGITIRLTGGANQNNCLRNGEQMGEGWSDWYGLMFTMEATDTPAQARPIGNFLLGQNQSGQGIRGAGYQPFPGAPYSTDFGVNSATYGDSNSGLSQPHGIGFVWATILWEMTWELIAAHGFDPDLYDAAGTAGNQIAMSLVTEALKLQPCSPGFVDGRDAILQADQNLYGGANQGLLWAAFARRGLGLSASQGSSGSRSDQVEAFDLPVAPGSFSYAPGSVTVTLNTGDMTTESILLSNSDPSVPVSWSASVVNATTPVADREIPATTSDALVAEAPETSGEIRVARATASSFATGDEKEKGGATDAPVTSSFAAGGPDTFGYTWIDSNEAGGPTFNWVDISSTGTSVSLGDDTGSSAIPLPFTFRFYGQEKSSVYIASNGFLTFTNAGMVGSASYNNTNMPNASAPSDMIAMLWDDLIPPTAGTIHYQDMGDGRFIVQFTGVPHWNNSAEVNTFQAILYDDGTILLQYLDLNDDASNPNSHTVGIENAAGDDALVVVYNASYTANNLAVRIAPPATWVTASPTSGSISAGSSATLDVDFDATGLPSGTYTADLVLTTDDPGNPSVTIPLTMIVGGAPPPGGGVVNGNPGWYLMGSPTANTTVDQLAQQNLVAGVPGFYPTFSGGPPGTPTLYTGYDGGAWTASTGAGEVVESGQGFLWYFWDQVFTPTEASPNASSAVAFPVTMTPPGPVNTADVDRTLHTGGNRINAMGNPFGTPLDLTDVQNWDGGNKIASRGRAFVWDPDLNKWIFGAAATTAEPWQGFAVRAKQSAAGKTLTIPASAAVPATKAAPTVERRRIEIALDGLDAATGRVLGDQSLEISFEDGAAAGWDDADALKFEPLSNAFVTVSALAELDGSDVLKAGESRALAPESFEVPLAIQSVGAASQMTLRWPVMHDLPSDWRVTLRDLRTGEETDLRQEQSYTFDVSSIARKASDEIPRLEDADASSAQVRFLLSVDTGVAPVANAEVARFGLGSVVPNPVQGMARVAFSLAEASEATVAVYDVQGREVAVLAKGRHEAGAHEVAWPTGALAPGVYVVRLLSGTEVATRRAVVVR